MFLDVSYLRELAHRCVRLAHSCPDRKISHELEAIAAELMDKAAEITTSLSEVASVSVETPPERLSSQVAQWQPISTAPKGPSGKAVYVLGYCPGEGLSPTGCVSVVWWEENSLKWFAEFDRANGVHPTHWHPLPEPPIFVPKT
jgi:hypothetical protein